MKWYRYFFIANMLIVLSCSQKKNKQPEQPEKILSSQRIEKKISIQQVCTLGFDQSFSFLQSTTLSEKKIEELMEETKKSGPVMVDSCELSKKFEELGIVRKSELLLKKFKYKSAAFFSFAGESGEKINIHIYRDTITPYNGKIIVSAGTDTSEIKADIYFEIKYALLDIIPGGNKELVLLNETYISNNNLYYLDVFEIKTAK